MLENDEIILRTYVVVTIMRENIEGALGNIKFLQTLVCTPGGGDWVHYWSQYPCNSNSQHPVFSQEQSASEGYKGPSFRKSPFDLRCSKFNLLTCFDELKVYDLRAVLMAVKYGQMNKLYLNIWLAVHHSITFLLLPTWYTNFLFIHINYIKLLYIIIHMYNLRRWPPDDGRIALETCRGI